MENIFQIKCIGTVRKRDKDTAIEIHEEYMDGLLGLDQFSHLKVCYWFHENDDREKRKILQVHPRGDKANPLTGVFATRSPQRPNLIGISTCKILSVVQNVIIIDNIDAFSGSPVIDVKPYLPGLDSVQEAFKPKWAK